ncbi:tetratricopeptide repeat protein [Streptomyces sp. Inha503]|uniref:tetratricopeptide repeat protein n=1 Tax=Streptomyces sp. Inha503 TaxID=3383314 RepID=UPI0039A0CB8A
MVDDDGGARLVRAGQLLADSWRGFWFDNGTEEIAGRLAEAERLYDSVAGRGAPGDAAPAEAEVADGEVVDAEVAATIAIGRSTIAAFALRLAVDVDHDLNSGWDWDDEGPPLGEMEWDEDGATAALADQSVAAARAALDADPDDPLVPLQLGQALAWTGDREGAVAAYEEALRRDPWDGTAHECLAQLEVTPAEPPPAGAGDPISRRPYGFAVLHEQGRISNSDWFEERRLFGTLSAARADADACLREIGDLEREFLDGMMKLELEIHRPGRPVTTYDLIARVPDAPDTGPFDIDWSGIPLDEPLESPLPPGRLLRMDDRACFYGSREPSAVSH